MFHCEVCSVYLEQSKVRRASMQTACGRLQSRLTEMGHPLLEAEYGLAWCWLAGAAAGLALHQAGVALEPPGVRDVGWLRTRPPLHAAHEELPVRAAHLQWASSSAAQRGRNVSV